MRRRFRRWELPVAVLFMAVALGGCLGGAEKNSGPMPDEATLAANDRVVRFGGTRSAQDAGLPTLAAHTVLTGFQGGEPTIGILPSGTIFVQAWGHTLRSTDKGDTWESVYEYSFETLLETHDSFDPMLWADPGTDRVYWNHLAPGLGPAPVVSGVRCTVIGWSEDEGETWTRNDHGCGVPLLMDFQKLGGGPPGPEKNPLTGKEHPTVLYLCYKKQGASVPATASHCAASYDGGETWPVDERIGCPDGADLRCGDIVWRPVVAPGGAVYLPFGSSIGVSSDSGLTWRLIGGPHDGGNSPLAVLNLAFTSDGTLYALGRGNGDPILHLARSRDGGATWDGPWRVSPPGVETNHFSALVAGDPGRVAMAFLGTKDPVDDVNEAPDEARWNLYMVVSDDANAPDPGFVGVRATDDPVQVGCIQKGGGACEGGRNLLDFIDATSHPDGTFYVSYADGCTAECATKGNPKSEDSRDDSTAVAWLEGWSLREARGQGEPM